MKVLRIILPFLETISCSLSGYFTGMVGSVGSDDISSLSPYFIQAALWFFPRSYQPFDLGYTLGRVCKICD